MFGFKVLTIDGTLILYEGKRADVIGSLGSDNAKLKSALLKAGAKYRRGNDRHAYEHVVDELIAKGRSRSPIRYEVIAQLYRSNLHKVLLDTSANYSVYGFKHPDRRMAELLGYITSWRDFWTGKATKTMSYDSYITSSYLTVQELKELLNSVVLSDEEAAINNLVSEQNYFTRTLLPVLQSICEKGNDVFIVHGGYVPKGLDLSKW